MDHNVGARHGLGQMVVVQHVPHDQLEILMILPRLGLQGIARQVVVRHDLVVLDQPPNQR